MFVKKINFSTIVLYKITSIKRFFFTVVQNRVFFTKIFSKKKGIIVTHYGSMIAGVLLGPLNEASSLTINILWWYGPYFYGGLHPIYFYRELGFWWLCICALGFVFSRPILEEHVFQVEGAPHLFQFCLCVVRDDFPYVTRDTHLSFESLAIINGPSLHASLMNFHHNTSIRPILEDDSISLASRAYICSCSGKGARLWLVVRPFIYSFCITHSTFTSMLHFGFSLI
jgi:hypothetical protein